MQDDLRSNTRARGDPHGYAALAEQREVISEHYRLAEELYGPDRCLPDMRKLAIKYARLHPQHELVRADFCQVKRPGAWRDVLDKWYGAVPSPTGRGLE